MMEDTVESRRLVFPGVAWLYARLAPYSYTLMRIALGLILMPHGINKLFFGDAVNAARNFPLLHLSPPLAWAYFIGVVECVGGLMLVLGFLTRVAALAIAVEMAVICFAILWPSWWWGARGMEFAALMGVYALAIFFRGGGRLSLDDLMAKEF